MIDSLPPDDEDHHLDDIVVDEKFKGIKVACSRLGQPKLIQAALSVIDKLVSSDLLIGDVEEYSTPESSPPASETETLSEPSRPRLRNVIDSVIGAIFNAVKNNDDDETHLLGVRCVLSCVLSRNHQVHGSALMGCIRTLFLINRQSKSSSVQSTTTTALTQIINSLTARVNDASQKSVMEHGPWAGSYCRNLLNKTVLLTFPDNEEGDNRGRMGWCVVCNAPGDYFCRRSREAVCSKDCKKKNLTGLKQASFSGSRAILMYSSRESRDLLTVLRSLCRLSSTSESSSSSADLKLQIKSKLVSLELISLILSESSAFSRLHGTAQVIKECLFESLLTNSVSPIANVFSVALDIFSHLVKQKYYKNDAEMIREIGIFINQVFVYILESENSSFMHKSKVLEISASSIFSDYDIVLELFQMFDCSIDEPNVVELTLNALRNIVTSSSSTEPDLQILKNLALNSFTSLVGMMASSEDKLSLAEPFPPVPSSEDHEESLATLAPIGVAPNEPVSLKQRKLLLQEGVSLFKSKPGKGIDFLIDNNFIESRDPLAVAKVLCGGEFGLDKTAIGEFIGDNKPFNLQCFYALVDRMDFAGEELDVSLRKFLSLFRLPGEAQKIDRIMEKFAEKFTQDNSSRYANNADAAFVLAFAVIMLNTDLHSPQIKKKMTMEEFVKLGRGINTEMEIAQSELERLYRNIQADAISLSEDDEMRKRMRLKVVKEGDGGDEMSVQRKRFELFMKETEQMIEKTRESLSVVATKMKKNGRRNGPAGDVMKELLQVGYPSILAAFRGSSTETGTVKPSAEIVRLAILFDLETVKSDFVSFLFHISSSSPEAVAAILAIAASSDSNGLGNSWTQVVYVFSRIEKSEDKSSSASCWQETIDLVFSNTAKLNPANILALTSALVTVSLETELLESPPRLFCAQRLVELADFNMGRIRLVWSKIWSLISPYFVRLALHPSSEISLFGIDSLRQLALKFMTTKQELGNYHFQSDFMRPFHEIIRSDSISKETQEMIVSVMDSLVQQVSENLVSGWISVFSCLRMAPGNHACEILRRIQTNTKALLKGDNFREFSLCLTAALSANEEEETLAAFAWDSFETHIDFLCSPSFVQDTAADERRSHWLSVFRALAQFMADPRDPVREKAVEILFSKIFHRSIDSVDRETIQIFLRAVLIPWLDDTLHAVGDSISWELGMQVVDQVSAALNFVIKTHFEVHFCNYMFEILNFNLILIMFDRNDKVPQLGLANIRASLIGNVRFEDLGKFDQVVEGLVKILAGTTPHPLLESSTNHLLSSSSSLPFNPERIVTVCSTHLCVIQLVGDLIDSLLLTSSDKMITEPQLGSIVKLMDALSRSKDFASRFNSEIQLREKYKSLGFMRDLKQLPGLLKQERAASTVSLKILFLVELNSGNFDINNEKLNICRTKLRIVCCDIVDTYIAKETKLGTVAVQIRDTLIDEIEREINGLVPLINSVIIAGFEKMTQPEFMENRHWIFDILLKLIKVANSSIRESVSAIMHSRIKSIVARN